MTRLLVVDDHADTLAMLNETLAMEGYSVDGAVSAADALARFAPGRYACLLTDHYLPDVTGLELVELLRLQEPALPVVILTGATEIINAPAAGMTVLQEADRAG